MQGWIKLYRELLQSDVFYNEKLLKVFIWCLCKASHTNHMQMVGRQSVPLEPGQFVTGRLKAGIELNMPPSTAWDYLKLLERSGTMNIKSNNKFSIVTIENCGKYQNDIKNPTTNEQQMDNKPTTNEQQMNTNKNGKNDKNVKKNIYSDIFNLYLEQEIIKHKELTDTMKKAIDKATKKFSIDEIKLAITRYGVMYRDKENTYAKDYCKYKWTLQELLTREKGISEFLNEGGKWIRYTDKQQGNNFEDKKTQEAYAALEHLKGGIEFD